MAERIQKHLKKKCPGQDLVKKIYGMGRLNQMTIEQKFVIACKNIMKLTWCQMRQKKESQKV